MELNWNKYTIGSLTAVILISFGIIVLPDDTHVCRDLEISKYCDRLSSTDKTCYPTPGVTVGKKYCSGKWEPIAAPEPLIIVNDCEYSGTGPAQCCSVQGCVNI